MTHNCETELISKAPQGQQLTITYYIEAALISGFLYLTTKGRARGRVSKRQAHISPTKTQDKRANITSTSLKNKKLIIQQMLYYIKTYTIHVLKGDRLVSRARRFMWGRQINNSNGLFAAPIQTIWHTRL